MQTDIPLDAELVASAPWLRQIEEQSASAIFGGIDPSLALTIATLAPVLIIFANTVSAGIKAMIESWREDKALERERRRRTMEKEFSDRE